ncbi:MAG: tetratricopeptide repeat protein [Planctomycetaceae bacterium]|nr:tetratricopeptide repeat protein [Planctomycetaceae bacterium]
MSALIREERLKQYRKDRETAKEFLLLGQKDDALKLLEDARQQANISGDDDFRMLFESLQICVVQPDHPQQVELLQQALQWETKQNFPLEQVMYLEIGRFYADADDQDTAISCFSEALKIDQSDFETLRLTGISIARQGDPDTALKWFETALAASDNTDSFSWREKAFTEQRIGNIDQALKSMEQAVQLRPDLWRASQEKLEKLCKTHPSLPPIPLLPKVSPEPISELLDEPAPYPVDDNTPIGGMEMEFSKNSLEAMVVEAVKSGSAKLQKRFFSESVFPKEKALWFFLEPPQTGWTSGGGHFLWNRGTGTIIDPGAGFLDALAEAGGTLAEVRNVVVTHDNESQLAEFETIRKLLQKGNLAKNVRFFLNLGAIQKLSATVDLNDKAFSEGYLTLYVGATYDLLGGGKIKSLPAYHQELKSADQAVGLQISLDTEFGEAKRIVYTSDTGLFPLAPSYNHAENRIVYVSDKNQASRILSRRYQDEGADNADLMILHFGQANVRSDKNVNEMQFVDPNNRPDETQLAELCTVGQLGFLGTREMLEQCRPKFAVLCQWAKELVPLRTELSELLQNQIGTESTKLVAGDRFLMYDIFADTVYDCVGDSWTAARKITTADQEGKLFYFAEETQKTFESSSDYYVNRFLNDLKYQQLFQGE